MKDKRTYIGFFQTWNKDEYDEYCNFFPVYTENPNKTFSKTFPDRSAFQNARLQLRCESKKNSQNNIRLQYITEKKENTLVKVSFEGANFNPQNGPCENIWCPLGVNFRDYIQVEGLSLSDIKKEDGWCVQLEVEAFGEHLIHSRKLPKVVEWESRPESGGLFKNIKDVPYIIYSKRQGLISEAITMTGSEGTFLEKEVNVYETKNVVIDRENVPFEATSWDNKNCNEDAFRYMQLVKITPKEGMTSSKGRLKWIEEENRYDLETPEKPIIGDMVLVEEALEEATLVAEDVSVEEPLVEESTEETVSKEASFNIAKQIHQYLLDSGRRVNEADVINYCICITQGFITTFAGAPGTGKTSLCRLLSKAMGLQEREELASEEDVANYTEVSVERGWTSLKDFIGYPDPFAGGSTKEPVTNKKTKKKAEPEPAEEDDQIIASNIDVYKAFEHMDKERRENADCGELPPHLMLLDEANLSPIEYYWSQFLRNCQLDDEDELKKRKILVSRKRAWLLSPNLRFLATVNFDHTTEELSPRFLDRTWVITLESPEAIGKKTNPASPEKPYSMAELEEAFGFSKGEKEFPEETKAVWEDIRDAFRDPDVRLPLSPRNINAVENYCIAAARFEGMIDGITALDFAVLQKILPTISGYGDRYEKLTSNLLTIAKGNELKKTETKLRAMRAEAKNNSNFYQFFIR